ncbi:MFS general substrate transporter [Cyberlindnera jadinii NRRL Y-1542]|uniref:MFS general substrate transporter n=1 Tax=Cyberlindnera jadinii (strain ATCC 18201 / CBS 1600 / BCRC 20928 / JCM 3617 / NBRC 0987 / NRRL Y-1542) TaxID=983966 RepID=A0A1E4S4E9_CYBJN|nr:MFS general substrate transporter [Cyberlindnera jadinii NRRL Y-1542]ODV74407.1 MFS general substrate transporter [Cyberlindnera jadinii NRRL Y-1542]
MNRVLVVLVCAVVGVTAGTLYLFSAYGPQLAHRLHYSGTDISLIGFTGSMGVALSGIPAGVVVDRSIPWAQFLGGLLISLGYFGLKAQFDSQFSSVGLSSTLTCLIGVGSTLINSAMIKCSAAMFPDNRGTATSFPVATYGLSAFAYSVTGHWFFGADTSRFLGYIASSALVICICGLPVIYYADKQQEVQQRGEDTLELEPYVSGASVVHASKSNMTKAQVLRSSRFWIVFSLLGILAGLGQLYIYSCGLIVKSLYHPSDENEINHAQSFQVSLLSICNCASRLMCGACGDFIANRLQQQRSWIVFVPAFVLLSVQVVCYFVSDYNVLWVSSMLDGVGYGFVWSSIPQLLLEYFGLEAFSFSWGFVNLSPILPGFLFTRLFGSYYDSNSTWDDIAKSKVCVKGNSCYNTTYRITFVFSSIALVLAVWINVRPYVQRRYSQVAQHS